MTDRYDVIIIGAGPAGLSAALVLGRACRHVLICDRGTPRSWAAKAMHAFTSREGINPQTFREVARQELEKLDVEFREVEVASAERASESDAPFVVRFAANDNNASRQSTHASARKLLIATGVFDHLPPIKGIEALFGVSVFQCPYCDGWEFRNQRVAVYGKGEHGFEMARAMTAWSSDIVLCTDGPSEIDDDARTQLHNNRIRVIEKPVEDLISENNYLKSIIFSDGEVVDRSVLFFDTPCQEQSSLAAQLGCQFSDNGKIECGEYEATSVPGVFAAGNIIKDVQLSIVAAAEGARAAFGINRALTREDFERRAEEKLRQVNAPLSLSI